MRIKPTEFGDQMKRTKLQELQLIDVQVPSIFFLCNKENECKKQIRGRKESKQSIMLYHKTVSIVLSASLYRIEHKHRLFTYNVCCHIGQSWRCRLSSHYDFPQGCPRHPVPVLTTLETCHEKFVSERTTRDRNTHNQDFWRKYSQTRWFKMGNIIIICCFPLPM